MHRHGEMLFVISNRYKEAADFAYSIGVNPRYLVLVNSVEKMRDYKNITVYRLVGSYRVRYLDDIIKYIRACKFKLIEVSGE